MLLKFARFFIVAAVLAPILLTPLFGKAGQAFPFNGFFPFIAFKAIFFRSMVQLALIFFLLYLFLQKDVKATWRRVWLRLKTPLVSSVIIFAFLALITAALAQSPTQAFWSNFERGEGAFQILHYALFFVLIALLFSDSRRLKKLLYVHVGVSVFVCLYGVFQFNALLKLKTAMGVIGGSERIAGTLGNPSYLAAYLLFTFAILLYLFLHTASKNTKITLAVIGLFELFIFLNTGTRGAYVALFVGAIIVGISALLRIQNTKKKMYVSLLILAAVALVAVGISLYYTTDLFKGSYILERLLNVRGAFDGLEPRLWTWNSALSTVGDRPFLGWGLENFPYGFDRYYNPNHWGIESFFDRTHNVFLEYAVSGGIALLIAYLAIWASALKEIIRKPRGLWRSALVATVVAYMIQGFFLFDVLSIYLAMFVFLALALLHENDTEVLDPEPEFTAGHVQLLTSIALLIGFIALFITTAAIPWKKNQLITDAYSYQYYIQTRPLEPEWVRTYFEKFQNAMAYQSPIGQEEAVNGALKFTLDIIEAAVRQGIAVPPELLRQWVNGVYQYYEKDGGKLVGVRDTYLMGGIFIRSGLSYQQPDYLAKGKELYAAALESSPDRIELWVVLLDLAQAQNNEADYNRILEKVKILRPDINWPPFAS